MLNCSDDDMMNEAQMALENKIRGAARRTGDYRDRLGTIAAYSAWCIRNNRAMLDQQGIEEIRTMYNELIAEGK